MMHVHTERRRLAGLGALLALTMLLLAALLRLPAAADAASADTAAPPAAALMVEPITLTVSSYAGGFSFPVDIASAGDDRLFVVQQSGLIRIIDGGGTVLATPFLDLSGKVISGGEQGLLGLVFAPDYATSGEFYVNYTADPDGTTTIARYTVSGDPDVADPTSEEIVLTVDQPRTNHNAGDLAFGPDGYLYVPLGDGGGLNNACRAQNGDELLGKILRLDVTGVATYTIPADNPFVGNPDVRDEIWALGFRNPFRFSFDRLTGDMWVGDVGQLSREEVDFQPAESSGGENYGWPIHEGNIAGPSLPGQNVPCDPFTDFTFPVHDYPRSDGSTITGGFVYRGADFPFLVGHYVFADFSASEFWTLRPDGNGGYDRTDHGTLVSNPSSFGEDQNGELYVASYSTGQIFRVEEEHGSIVFTEFVYLPTIVRE